MFNDDFKNLGRTSWEDEECFFKMMDKKGTTDVKHEFKKKKIFYLHRKHTRNKSSQENHM